MIAVRALAKTRLRVRIFRDVKNKHGATVQHMIAGSNIVFERMSPADVWDLITTAARARLFRVPHQAIATKKLKKKKRLRA